MHFQYRHGMARGLIDCYQKITILCLISKLYLLTQEQFPAFFLMLDFCNTRPKLLTNQERRQRLLLNEVPPFVKSGHKC